MIPYCPGAPCVVSPPLLLCNLCPSVPTSATHKCPSVQPSSA
ncbi:unnamed protein product, partial [Staurois parvus]